MPTIGDFEYGYDQEGMNQYLEQIKSTELQNAKDAVEDISSIKTVCENEWEGKARENFVANLEQDAKHVSEQFTALYQILESEINSAQAAMANKDEELIQVG